MPPELDRNLGNRGLALECACDTHVDAVGAGLDGSRRRHGILARHAVENGLRRDTERRQFTVAELDEDALFADADDVDLGDARGAQQALAHDLGIVLELGKRDVGARQHIDGGIDVAVFVVEERALHALGQCRSAVGQLLAHLVPGVLDFLRPRGVLELHLDDDDAGPRVGLDVVE